MAGLNIVNLHVGKYDEGMDTPTYHLQCFCCNHGCHHRANTHDEIFSHFEKCHPIYNHLHNFWAVVLEHISVHKSLPTLRQLIPDGIIATLTIPHDDTLYHIDNFLEVREMEEKIGNTIAVYPYPEIVSNQNTH